MSQIANFIEVRLEDGTVLRAEGAHATEVWKWLQGCEGMASIHGFGYTGKPMIEIKPEAKP